MYARYSSDNQRDESVEAQIRAMTKYCQDNEIAIVGEYIDRAKSATTDDRPEFQRMIADSKQGTFNIVLVHKSDRFSRNRRDRVITPNPHSFYACGLAAVRCVPDGETPWWYAVCRQGHAPAYPLHETADLSMNAPQ